VAVFTLMVLMAAPYRAAFPQAVHDAAKSKENGAKKAAVTTKDSTLSFGLILTESRIIYLQRKEFRLFPEGADQSGPTAHAAQSAARLSAELSEVLRTEVGQLVLLPVRPEILDRI